ncbi:MAG: preprotein translocase subunit SecG [bacterium]
MGILTVILTTVEVIVALLLIGIILIQQTRSGGGLGALGGGVTDSVFGAGAGNFLTKMTVILSAVFFVVTLSLVLLAAHSKQGQSVVEKLAVKTEAKAGDAKASAPAVATTVKTTAATAVTAAKPAAPPAPAAVPPSAPVKK